MPRPTCRRPRPWTLASSRPALLGMALASLVGCAGEVPSEQSATAAAGLTAVPLITTIAPPAWVEGQVIVRFVDAPDIESANTQLGDGYRALESIFRQLDVFVVELQPGHSVPDALADLGSNPHVMYAQADHLLSRRASFPNDPQFAKQWGLHNVGQSVTDGTCGGSCGGQASDCYCDSLCVSYGDCCADACAVCGYCGGGGVQVDADIDAPEAWDRGTGLDVADPPVVAILEGGCDTNHTDLAANLWVNPGEIAGNGVDDDGNGYKDDVNGWNISSNNGFIPQNDAHGTEVSGVVGARGDNGTGVAGVDHGARLMIVASNSTATSQTVASYQYAATLKEQWLDSGGSAGANVVATNSSFGFDFASCTSGSYPLWDDMYDALGALGVLSAISTTNNNVNVDSQGDVPSTCASPWMIAVTATDQGDGRAGTGYGATHIDLGAPGVKIRSTSSNNSYATVSGTSFASPMVAGAVALLHSQAPAGFLAAYLEDPAGAALELKAMLLDGADPIADLQGKSVSGGRLNVDGAGALMQQYCTPSCGGALCGDDGCGGTCGHCGTGEVCEAGACVDDGACEPSCGAATCGDDGCGGSCGVCGTGEACEGGACVGGGDGASLEETLAANPWMASFKVVYVQPVGTSWVRLRAKITKVYKGCYFETGDLVAVAVKLEPGCAAGFQIDDSWVMGGGPMQGSSYSHVGDGCSFAALQGDLSYDQRQWLIDKANALSCD